MALNEIQQKTKKKDWQLTQEGFDKLLSLLDPDRELAAEKYELLRRRLLKLFEWRGSPSPEEHADETFNRVARKIVEGVEIRNVNHFVGGVARRLFLEIVEQREREEKMINQLPDSVTVMEITDDEVDPRLDCFRECLNELPPDQRQLIVDYYREDDRGRIGQRKHLAAALQIPLNALRIRAHRLRSQLDTCIHHCLKND
jgi:DNA-directed RNA polymerase specialized sigma24 family protein